MTKTRSALRGLAWAIGLAAAAGFALWIAFFRPPRVPLGSAIGPAPRHDDEPTAALQIALHKIAEGIEQPTDIQFPPGATRTAVVLQKTGTARWLDVTRGMHGELFRVEVRTASEEGLLGLAFHPKFLENGRFFLNYVAPRGKEDVSRVAEWSMSGSLEEPSRVSAAPVRVLMEVVQPYVNHDGGQLAFGPDGYLYVGWGDGGASGDPHNHGQDGTTFLGSMLRIDVDAEPAADGSRAYAIPKDNPFLGKPEFAPETWAYGLRNPWRYSFDPDGRLIVADVGQNSWEEIDIVQAGDNLGWSIREGFACSGRQPSECERDDLVAPVLAYGHSLGNSVTGGFVYTGTRVPVLRGLYVFGDFGSGRLFAMTLPRDREKPVQQPLQLGRWAMQPSTFGRDAKGELYVADFGTGDIYRIGPH